MLNFIKNSLICARTNNRNFTMILSVYRSKSHSFQSPKKRIFPGFFSSYPKPGLKILPRIGNTTLHPPINARGWTSRKYHFSSLRYNRQVIEPSQPALVVRALPTAPLSRFRLKIMTQNKILVQFHNYFVVEKVQWQLLVINTYLKIGKVNFQTSTLDQSHHLLVKRSCESACENLEAISARSAACLLQPILQLSKKSSLPPLCLRFFIVTHLLS